MFGRREVEISPLVPAAWVTLAEVKTYLGIADGSKDTILTALIATATPEIEAYCGNIIAQRTVTERCLPEDNLQSLALAHFPVSALTSIAFDDVAQTVGDYRFSSSAGTVRRRDGADFYSREITIIYTAGYAPGSIPAPILEATKIHVGDLLAAQGRDFNIKRESVPDVGTVEYAGGEVMFAGANGVRASAAVASRLAPFVRRFGP